MDNSQKTKRNSREKRVMRVRKKLRGNGERPRLSISKTNFHLYAQLIDDESSLTLVGMGTYGKKNPLSRSKEGARELGRQIAEAAKQKNITSVIFDRGRFKFHGIVAEVAAGAREAGLQF